MLSNSIINEVIREKQAVLSSDATIDSRFSGAHSIIMQGIRSTMCVPLLHGVELLGIMNLDSQIATNAFSEKDLRIFTGIATQAAIAIQNARLAHKIEYEARTRAQFQRFFSPSMVQQMVEGKLKLDSVGETREATILFADIRGFTAMTENADAHEIVALLNDYFEVMVEVLFEYDGTLDKYVGDEIMALFGVPVDSPDVDGPRGGVRRGDAERADGVQPHAARREPAADQRRHRHQHRRGGLRRHRVEQDGAVHRHRRRGEHRLAPLLGGQGRRSHHQRRDHVARSPTTSRRWSCPRCGSRASWRSWRSTAR